MSTHAEVRAKEQHKAEEYLRRAGYKSGGDVAASAVHKHEREMHPGKPLTKLRGGGKVHGDGAKPRQDRYARGGKVSKGPAKINIVIATGGGEGERQAAFQQGTRVGASLGAAPRPPMPMMPPRMPPGAAPAMPPGGAPGAPPPGMAGAMAATAGMPPLARPPMKRGGSVKVNTVGGSESGIGRLEKSGMDDLVPVRAHTRRKSGGRV